jgi:hypothetical protein
MDANNSYGVKTHHEVTLDGQRFETTLYPSGKAIDLLPFMISLAAGPAGVVTDLLKSMTMGGQLTAGDTSGREVRESLLTLADQIVKHGGSAKLREILSHTYALGEVKRNAGQDMDVIFQGRLMLQIKVVAWVLEVNYAPFLREKLGDYKALATLVWQRLQQQPDPQQPA